MVAGTALYHAAGYAPVFWTVVGLEVAAALLMLWTARHTGRRWRVDDELLDDTVATAPR